MTATVEETKEDQATKDDMDVILPNVESMEIGGYAVRIRRLKTWEYMAGIRVLTTGVGEALPSIKFDTSTDTALQQSLLAIVISAAPRAINELKVFTEMVVDPKNESDRSALANYIRNDLDVMEFLDIVTVIAIQEKDEIRELVGKVPATFKMLSRQLN